MQQKTDSESGNNIRYFEREFKGYEDGFGLTSREYWIGLKQMWLLTEMGNTLLRIEGTFHNGSAFWVEYDNFIIKNATLDDTKYQLSPDQEKQINQNEKYPITSMKQINSSSSVHQFVVIRPNYLNRCSNGKCSDVNKLNDRERGSTKEIQDRFFAGFFAQV